MNRRCVFLKCDQCGAQFSVTFGCEGRQSVLPHECPVCHAHVGASNLSNIGQAPSFRGNLRAELEALLCAARNQGVSAGEIMQALQEELQFEAELSGRNVAVNVVELGPAALHVSRFVSRDRKDTAPPRSATA